MKIEPRGKYPGVKVHLDGDEAQMFLDIFEDKKGYKSQDDAGMFAVKLGKKIHGLIGDHPNLLKERTEEEIQKALEVEQEAATEKLAAIKKGKDWKKVSVK